MFSIERELCINCGRCVEVCPMGIFRAGEAGPEVGEEKRCIRCMHCAAACPVRAVRCEGIAPETLYPAAAAGGLARLVQRRRSIRRYRPEAPERSVLESALAAAANAPSAKNRRACRWTVLYGKDKADWAAQLAFQWALAHRRQALELVAMTQSNGNLVTCGASCVVACCGPAAAETDGAIATTTLELLLCEAGLGTCWAGFLTAVAAECPELREYLGAAEGEAVLCALMTGTPDEAYPNPALREAWETTWK